MWPWASLTPELYKEERGELRLFCEFDHFWPATGRTATTDVPTRALPIRMTWVSVCPLPVPFKERSP